VSANTHNTVNGIPPGGPNLELSLLYRPTGKAVESAAGNREPALKAIRNSEKIGIDQKSQVGSVTEELADILIYLCSITASSKPSGPSKN
jgi:hypothetical protein